MNRRGFLGSAFGQKTVLSPTQQQQNHQVQTSLASYTGPWTFDEAAHLLRRTLFGTRHNEITQAVSDGLDNTLDRLMTTGLEPDPPVNAYFQNDIDVPIGQSWVDAPFSAGTNGYRRITLMAWSMGQMINQPVSIREKMLLFWHNHFAVEAGVVNDPRFLYRYVKTLRENALGNFKTLVEKITIDPTMLRYLNGNQNTAVAPNENYARELFELFTIGKGPQLAPGNYTHYTEDDVIAAAKVLTGWRDRGHNNNFFAIDTEFVPNRHDTSTKQFSSAFNDQTIADNGADEYKDLITMIFGQTETARFIVRKLYRWFVYYVIDPSIEADIIEPLATILINNNFDIEPVLRTLFKSEHFYDVNAKACLIKNPLDFTISLIRQNECIFPDESQNLAGLYGTWRRIYQAAETQQMAFLQPPSVAGWPAYYQIPGFHENWINSVTLPERTAKATELIMSGIGQFGGNVQIQPLDMIGIVSDATDPNILIGELTQFYMPQALTQGQLDFLKEVLIPGLPDIEWTVEYNAYLNNPNDQNLRDAVDNKLRVLFNTMFNLAEYQLS
ncbi:MAG: DUF1800 domain-containing protein [Bacteroidota bacterium]